MFKANKSEFIVIVTINNRLVGAARKSYTESPQKTHTLPSTHTQAQKPSLKRPQRAVMKQKVEEAGGFSCWPKDLPDYMHSSKSLFACFDSKLKLISHCYQMKFDEWLNRETELFPMFVFFVYCNVTKTTLRQSIFILCTLVFQKITNVIYQ